jgi:hypothetical protein
VGCDERRPAGWRAGDARKLRKSVAQVFGDMRGAA